MSIAKSFAAVLLIVPTGRAARAQSAEEVLQKTRDTYSAMKSYADTGVVRYEYGPSSQDQHTFSTAFNRAPRHVLLDFHKQGGDRYVIWADADAFHTWWKTTGQKFDYPNPNNVGAINGSTQPTYGVALKIPTLLYGKAFDSAMLKMGNPALEGSEQIGGHRCHRVSGRASDVYGATGHEVNVHRVTVWIDTESFLVRQIAEDFNVTPGTLNKVVTIFEPQANLTLDEAKFRFAPPPP